MVGQYCEMGGRPGVIVYGVDDALPAAVLPLARVQYILPGDVRTLAATNIDFRGRGIIASAAEYSPDRPAPSATVILAPGPAELQAIVDAAGDRDLLLPSRLTLQSARHAARPAAGGYCLLLSKHELPAAAPRRSCEL